jgi:hypothetical protein
MGNTYETDAIESRDAIALTLQAAMVMQTAGRLVACRSWLAARLVLKALQGDVLRLAKMIEEGSKT